MLTRPLITTDCHLSPPPELADELPAKYRSEVTHLEHRSDGTYLVRPDLLPEGMREIMDASGSGDVITAMLAEGVKVDPQDRDGVARIIAADVCAQASPGFTAQRYIEDLDRDGVVGAVLIGTAAFGIHADTEVDVAWTRLVNDWTHDTFKDHLDRFAPGISLPLGDVGAAVRELERAAGLGMRPALIPDVIPAVPYVDPAWEPLWEAAEGLGVPLATHVGVTRGINAWADKTAYTPGLGATGGFVLTSLGMAETVSWFACSGILERHPGLKVVNTECSAGWLAWLINFLDHHYFGRFGNEFLTDQGFQPMKATEAPPSFYIKRQIACTFMDDPVAIRNRDLTGLDCLMWGNDYPHQEGVFPNSQEWVEKQFAGVPEPETMHIVHDNAAKVYELSV
jgi:predicted TIM-barrel fold metal-dependent hydrolase